MHMAGITLGDGVALTGFTLVLDDDVGLGVVVEEELGAALLVLDDDVGLGVVVEHV